MLITIIGFLKVARMLIDAVLTPAEIDLLPQCDLGNTVCIIFDVLRATSSILTALASGAEEICPVASIEEALAKRREWPDAVLGGERYGDRIDGFDIGNSPLEYRIPGLRRIVTTTTNGTVALRACAGAQEVWVGALLNMQALVDRLCQQRPGRVLLVCAGTFREIALEDVLTAGMLTAAFPEAKLTDDARISHAVYKQCGEVGATLESARNGKALLAKGRKEDVAWCAQVSLFPVVGIMRDGIIRPA